MTDPRLDAVDAMRERQHEDLWERLCREAEDELERYLESLRPEDADDDQT